MNKGFLAGTHAQSAVEWLVVAALIVALLGGVLWDIHTTLAQKLEAYHAAL